MVDFVKVQITEQNGVELDFPCEYSLISANVPYDKTLVNELVADNAQSAIDELSTKVATSASPGFSFGRSSNVNTGTWLNCEGVPSNKSGRWVYINQAKVTRVFVSNEVSTTFTLEVFYHDGGGLNLTSLGTVAISSAYGDAFTVDWSVPTDKQLAIQLISGSGKNVVAGLELQGTN